MSKKALDIFLSQEERDRVALSIGEAELRTSGEIRLSIIEKRSLLERRHTIEQFAWREFQRMKMHMTAERTGVLILILLGEHRFQILADEGIHKLLSGDPWGSISQALEIAFRKGDFCDGICRAVVAVGDVLALHAPRRPGDINELPDDIVVR